MIKTFAPKTCAFDCEWIPCPDTARRLLNLPQDTTDADAIAQIWAHYAKEGEDRPFLKLAISKIVSIAAVLRHHENGRTKLALHSQGLHTLTEAELIGDFLERVAKGEWQLWGFNSASSDLPILKQRAFILDIPCPNFNARPDKYWTAYDYHDNRSDAHMDILHLLANFARGGAVYPSLHELAVASGIPGKLDASGSDVADLYLADRIPDIVAYNETDALTTHLLMLRLAHNTGRLDAAAYKAELTAVEQLLEREIAKDRTHLAHFRDAWHAYRND